MGKNGFLCTKLTELNKRWRIGAVSYLNTLPFLLGIEQSDFMQQIELVKDYPAKIAQGLIEGTIDIGLVPVAIVPSLKEAHFVSKYCIGAEGPVASVSIFSQVPMEQIEQVYLDYQSRTSIQLAQILLKQYWKKEVEFIPASEGYIEKIAGTTAGVIIGDRALAAIPTAFMEEFDAANAYGLQHLDEVIAGAPASALGYDLHKYYSENISYPFTAEKRKGMELFLKSLIVS